MSRPRVFCVVILTSLLYPGAAAYYNYDPDTEEARPDILGILRNMRPLPEEPNELLSSRNLSIVSFTWNDCGSEAIHFKKLDISPTPIHLPGKITVAFTATLSKNVEAPLEFVLDLQKKGLIRWKHVPCFHHLGSCSYDNICSIIQSQPCPAALKQKCQCPFANGTYVLPSTEFQLPTIHVPKFVKRGHYKMNAKLNQAGENVLCLDCEFQITA